MIRIIVATTDACRAAHVGGPVEVTYRTFDVVIPELEAFMAERDGWKKEGLLDRTVVGVELIPGPVGPDVGKSVAQAPAVK
jgi:hypothetical protein